MTHAKLCLQSAVYRSFLIACFAILISSPAPFRIAGPAILGAANLRSADQILLQYLRQLRFGAELPGGLHDL